MITYEQSNKEYDKTSRYQVLRVVNDEGSQYLETYNQVKIPESDDDLYHIVSNLDEGRIDLISYKYYKDTSYWWAIALANNIIDPLTIPEGTVLRIPSLLSLSSSRDEILSKRW